MSFYVSVKGTNRAGKGKALLALGPFTTHGGALAQVDRVRRYVVEKYRDGWTYAYGTCREKISHNPGALNDALGYEGPGELP